MSFPLHINVSSLDGPHRQALEDVIGQPLALTQQIIISLAEVSPSEDPRPPQTLEQWLSIYDGLSADEIEEVHQAINDRDYSTRDVP